jgi:hypothetical protein
LKSSRYRGYKLPTMESTWFLRNRSSEAVVPRYTVLKTQNIVLEWKVKPDISTTNIRYDTRNKHPAVDAKDINLKH